MHINLLYLISIYLLTLLTVICQGGEVYTVTRSPYFFSDVFKVPASNCTKNGAECASYNNAYRDDGPCNCSCPYDASTFGFYAGSWTCLDNIKVRQQAGCGFKFSIEMTNGPLMILEMETSGSYVAIFPSDVCSVNYAESRYFDCDGTWKTLRSKETSNFVNMIEIIEIFEPQISWAYSFMVSKNSLAGRIVSLQLNCTPSQSSRSCLLFKIAGKITCPSVLTQLSSTSNPISITTTGSNLTKSPGPRNQTQHGHQSGSSSSSSPGTIAAAVINVVFVIILAAVIGFVIWKGQEETCWLDPLDSTTTLFKTLILSQYILCHFFKTPSQ